MRRVREWYDRWMVPLAVLLFASLTVAGFPAALSASRNEGTFGTFTADYRTCTRYGGCEWTGTFESDDGRIRPEVQEFDAPGLRQSGDQARAQKVVGDDSLFRPNSRTWVMYVLGDLAGAAAVTWWVKKRRWRKPEARLGDST